VTTKYLAKVKSPTSLSWSKIIQPEWISKLICDLSLYTLIPKIKSISQIIFTMIWDIDLILGMKVYNHKLQIKFEIHFGWMIFGQLTAVGLWNLAGNNIAWTNLDMIRNLQHLHMNKKSYTYKTLPFNSHWIIFWIKKTERNSNLISKLPLHSHVISYRSRLRFVPVQWFLAELWPLDFEIWPNI
jgi:hypothetical protein